MPCEESAFNNETHETAAGSERARWRSASAPQIFKVFSFIPGQWQEKFR